MSDERLTRMERWALAVGAPVIAASVIAVGSILWGLYNTQLYMRHQLDTLVDTAYTEKEAEREFTEIEYQLNEHGQTLERHNRRIQQLEGRNQ